MLNEIVSQLQEQINQLQRQVNLLQQQKIVECNYGGILHYIKSHYENLFNEIALTSSPERRENGDVPIKTILAQDDPNSYFVCLAQPNLGSWICFDFKSRKINLTDYTLRSNMIKKGNGFHPRSWFIEGSNDKLNWISLDMQKDCARMNDINAIITFSIQNRSPQNFRYIRMRLISNWAGGTELSLSLIELYGKIYF